MQTIVQPFQGCDMQFAIDHGFHPWLWMINHFVVGKNQNCESVANNFYAEKKLCILCNHIFAHLSAEGGAKKNPALIPIKRLPAIPAKKSSLAKKG